MPRSRALRPGFPGLGQVTFFGTPDAARDILRPGKSQQGAHPEPDRSRRRSGSLILLSGERTGANMTCCSFGVPRRADQSYGDIIAAATADEIRSVRPGESIGCASCIAITLHVAIRVVFSVADTDRRWNTRCRHGSHARQHSAADARARAAHHELGERDP